MTMIASIPDDRFPIVNSNITSKVQGGMETCKNILILCPNHYKEFE